ncbi:hypothetical protein H4Q26_007638 [Puccinia striiformis f. sp. tritici PST-130]|nr:hypothetical protein H4Q26_007638 [Puccinia striiformis f. sp. tritici PST-130]
MKRGRKQDDTLPPPEAERSRGPFAKGGQITSEVEHQPDVATMIRRQFFSKKPTSSASLGRALQTNDLNGASPDSPGPPSSQFSHSISAHEYQCPSSRSNFRVPPPSSGSLPPLIADSSPQSGQLSNMGFNSYPPSSADVDSSPSAFRSPHSQMSERYNSCYSFMILQMIPSPRAFVPSRKSLDSSGQGPLPGQHTLPNGSLSTLSSLRQTRSFDLPKLQCSYQPSSLLPSPALEKEEYGQPDGTTTPFSTSQPMEFEPQLQSADQDPGLSA